MRFLDAIAANRVEDVKRWLSLGCDVNGVGDNGTPLSVACRANQIAMATLLLDHEADVDLENGSGATALCAGGVEINLALAVYDGAAASPHGVVARVDLCAGTCRARRAARARRCCSWIVAQTSIERTRKA